MPVLDSHVFDITRAIQLAVAPVFLLTAIGTLINALTGRLGRAIDRRRKLEELLGAYEGETRLSMERELAALAKRIKLVLWAIAWAVLSALLVCVLIGTAFLGAFVAMDLSKPVAALFVLAIAALTLCLLAFLREVFLAAVADRTRYIA
jgi:polyferredoxin